MLSKCLIRASSSMFRVRSRSDSIRSSSIILLLMPLLCIASISFLMLSSRDDRVCFCVSIRSSSSCGARRVCWYHGTVWCGMAAKTATTACPFRVCVSRVE